MSLTDRVLEAVKSAIVLESRVAALAEQVGDLARDVREMDKRLVRVETVIEFGMKGRGSSAPEPPLVEDRRD
jgi:hypothetical protein